MRYFFAYSYLFYLYLRLEYQDRFQFIIIQKELSNSLGRKPVRFIGTSSFLAKPCGGFSLWKSTVPSALLWKIETRSSDKLELLTTLY
jgi:hypothetical protein